MLLHFWVFLFYLLHYYDSRLSYCLDYIISTNPCIFYTFKSNNLYEKYVGYICTISLYLMVREQEVSLRNSIYLINKIITGIIIDLEEE